ncbi:MAG: hypothetical protein V4507_10225 [Verrucomicrobiota bacterium]
MNNASIQVHCPSCQHQQTEPEGVISTNCRACGSYIRVSDAILKPVIKSPKATRTIECIHCQTPIRVVETALSSICPNCSTHLNLQSYKLTAGDDANINTLGTVSIQGRKRYDGNEIQASRIEIGCKVSARLIAREEAIFSHHGSLDGKLEAPKISIAPKSTAKARLLLTPFLEVEGEILCDQIRAKKIVVRHKGNLSAKRIFCEEIIVDDGGVLRGRLTTFNLEQQIMLNP